MDNEKFGSFIKELRNEKGITQKQLSEVLGITGGAVSKWERGLSFPDITLLGSLADYFGVTVTELLEGERGIPAEQEDIGETINQATVNAEINAARRTRERIKKILIFLSPAVFTVCALLQAGYIFVMNQRGYEYIYDFLFPLINAAALLSAGIFAVLTIKSKKVNLIIFALCGFLMMLNIIFYGAHFPKRHCIVTVSSNLKYTVTVKIDRETGGATLYRNTELLLFAKPKERLENDVVGDIKTQWLQKDICTLVWQDSSDRINAFTATFGTRGDTTSYDYVAPSLLGDWMTDSGKDIRLSADSKGITLKADGESEFFEYSDCKQYGTIALVLKSDGVPKYNVALNRDCVIDQKTGIIKDGGTITLCPVSTEKTPAYTLYCTTHKGDDLNTYKIIDIDRGGYAIKNGTLYISYDGENAVALPYPSDQIIINDKLLIIGDEKTVFVRIENGAQHLVISDDRGKEWYEYPLEVPYSANAIQFIDSKIGFMFEICDVAMGTARGRISKTADGGKSWKPIFSGIETSNGPVFKTSSEFIFTSETVGFLNMPTASENECPLYRTLDGGKTFVQMHIGDDRYDYYTLPKQTENGLELTVSGGSDENPEFAPKEYISYDGGKNWQEKDALQ